MMIGHLTLFGLAEVVFTTGVLAYLRKTSPDLFQLAAPASSNKSLFGLLAALIVATPLGLLAAGTAWGEWDAEELADTDFFGSALGYTPAGMETAFPSMSSCRTTPLPACPTPPATSFRPS